MEESKVYKVSEPKTWKVTVGEDVIEVSGKGLFINGKLQDTAYGVTTNCKFEGRLPDGRIVRTAMGPDGFGFKIHCTIFVDYECVFQE